MEPFITTYTGKKLNPLKLEVTDIRIADIAHHLACINRFVGALRHPVSVAQHSVFVSRLLHQTGWEREGLFHDATEAYLGDVSKWLKRSDDMKAYREAEDRAWIVICKSLQLKHGENIWLKKADDLMVRYEAMRELMNPGPLFDLPTHPVPTSEEIDSVGAWAPWSWRESERGFLDHARLLGFPV